MFLWVVSDDIESDDQGWANLRRPYIAECRMHRVRTILLSTVRLQKSASLMTGAIMSSSRGKKKYFI